MSKIQKFPTRRLVYRKKENGDCLNIQKLVVTGSQDTEATGGHVGEEFGHLNKMNL